MRSHICSVTYCPVRRSVAEEGNRMQRGQNRMTELRTPQRAMRGSVAPVCILAARAGSCYTRLCVAASCPLCSNKARKERTSPHAFIQSAPRPRGRAVQSSSLRTGQVSPGKCRARTPTYAKTGEIECTAGARRGSGANRGIDSRAPLAAASARRRGHKRRGNGSLEIRVQGCGWRSEFWPVEDSR